jgi:hypothetical protein
MTTDSTPVSRDALHAWMLKVLQRKGMFAADAELVASRLIEAEHRGRAEYGLVLLGEIVGAMDLGDIDPRARTLAVLDLPGTAILDGSTGAGQVGATQAMQAAIHKAQAAGVGLAIVKNSQPCGDVRLYAELAAQAGCIGFCTTNMGKAALPAGNAPVFGAHPQAWAVPAGDNVLVSLQFLHEREPDVSRYAGERGLISLVLTAGLTGARTPSQKRKASPYGAGAEHCCLAIHGGALQAEATLPAVVTETWQLMQSAVGGWEAVAKSPLPDEIALSATGRTAIDEVAKAVRIAWD